MPPKSWYRLFLGQIYQGIAVNARSVAVEATKNWVGKTSRTKLYLKDIVNLITSFSWLKKRILDTDGHMTNCIKNNLQKELNYDCRAHPSTQVELVLPNEKMIKMDWLGFEPWSLGWKAAMLAPRPQLLHIFFSKSMKVIFNGFFSLFSRFFSLYIIFLGILWIFKAKKTLDSTELYLWDYYYSNLMTHSFYQN